MTDLAAQMDRLDPAREWQPWRPGPTDPWGLKWAGHLYRRAAFGGSWPELKAAVKAGPDATIERLFAGGPGQAEFDQLMDAVAPGRPIPASRASPNADPFGVDLEGLVAAPDDPHPAPAPGADDPVLAQPLRHQHRQGPAAGPDARPEPAAPRSTPWASSARSSRR